MSWKQTWEPEAVLALICGVLAVFIMGSLAAVLLHQGKVSGFRSEESVGMVLLATLSFHGSAIVLGGLFLRAQGTAWRDVFGETPWPRCLGLACAALIATAPFIFGLKWLSDAVLARLHWKVDQEPAVELMLGAHLWMKAYMVFFAVVLAPLAEEFFFRGLLFSTARRFGWRKTGWIGVSLLFALVHFNAPTFLPLFVLALAFTWLYEKTDGLLAPVLAHCLFNSANLVLLLLT
jgi:membrane protease YdiL (CAAX protease family)